MKLHLKTYACFSPYKTQQKILFAYLDKRDKIKRKKNPAKKEQKKTWLKETKIKIKGQQRLKRGRKERKRVYRIIEIQKD